MPTIRIFLLAALLAAAVSPAGAQTIIPLERGGGVRAKTLDDYRAEMNLEERARKDSAAYADNLRLAFNALAADSLDEAGLRFKAALKARPDAPGNYIIRYNLALVDMAQGRYKQAGEKLDAVLKDHPGHADARLARARAHLQQDHAREAVSDAEALLSRPGGEGLTDEQLFQARFVRAAARYRLHLYPDARADILLLLRQQPAHEGARLLEALTLQKMGQPKEALNRLNLIVASNPQSVDALTTRAAVLSELGQAALARNDYDALIALQPDDSNLYIERARTLLSLGEKAAARRDLDRAVSLGTPKGVVQSLYNLTRQ